MSSEESILLAVEDPAFPWAVPAGRVQAVVPVPEWDGEPPVDVGLRWGAAQGVPPATARVVVLQADRGPVAVLARAPAAIRRFPAAAITPVPDLVRRAGCPSAIAAVVLPEEQPHLFVLSPEPLAEPPRSMP